MSEANRSRAGVLVGDVVLRPLACGSSHVPPNDAQFRAIVRGQDRANLATNWTRLFALLLSEPVEVGDGRQFGLVVVLPETSWTVDHYRFAYGWFRDALRSLDVARWDGGFGVCSAPKSVRGRTIVTVGGTVPPLPCWMSAADVAKLGANCDA